MQLHRSLSLLFIALLTVSAFGQVPRSRHVVVVTLENHSYEQAVGNTSMPYFNSLIAKGAIADRYYSTMHNSLSALMWLTAGATVTTNDSTTHVFNVNNIVREMQKSGRTWKSYQSELPYTGYMGFNVGYYVKRHNPLSYFSDVQSSLSHNFVPTVPYFQRDIADGTLPEYSYVTPDLLQDAHNGTLAQADEWLSHNIPQLLGSKQFQEDGILLIIWDEGSLSPLDSRYGGGRTATVVLGPHVKKGFHSQVQYNTQSALRTTCEALALTGCPGAAATAVAMEDLFTGVSASNLQVGLLAPSEDKVDGTTHIQANGFDGGPAMTGMAAYIGGSLVARSSTASLTKDLALAPGTYALTVKAWDTSGASTSVQRTVTVTAPTLAVNLVFPTTTNVSGPLQIQASAVPGKAAVTGMASYVDGRLVSQTSGLSVAAKPNVAAGSHTVTVKVWDAAGHEAETQYSVNVK